MHAIWHDAFNIAYNKIIRCIQTCIKRVQHREIRVAEEQQNLQQQRTSRRLAMWDVAAAAAAARSKCARFARSINFCTASDERCAIYSAHKPLLLCLPDAGGRVLSLKRHAHAELASERVSERVSELSLTHCICLVADVRSYDTLLWRTRLTWCGLAMLHRHTCCLIL